MFGKNKNLRYCYTLPLDSARDVVFKYVHSATFNDGNSLAGIGTWADHYRKGAHARLNSTLVPVFWLIVARKATLQCQTLLQQRTRNINNYNTEQCVSYTMQLHHAFLICCIALNIGRRLWSFPTMQQCPRHWFWMTSPWKTSRTFFASAIFAKSLRITSVRPLCTVLCSQLPIIHRLLLRMYYWQLYVPWSRSTMASGQGDKADRRRKVR